MKTRLVRALLVLESQQTRVLALCQGLLDALELPKLRLRGGGDELLCLKRPELGLCIRQRINELLLPVGERARVVDIHTCRARLDRDEPKLGQKLLRLPRDMLRSRLDDLARGRQRKLEHDGLVREKREQLVDALALTLEHLEMNERRLGRRGGRFDRRDA